MKCCYCSAELAPNAKFCRHCGKEILTYCTECGTQLDKNAQYCPTCGTKIVEIKEEEKKTDILPTTGEIALKMTEKVLDKVAGDSLSTHTEEMHNARPAQLETPAHSESPAKPQETTHSGSAGGAGQKFRRDSASVRAAAEQQAQTETAETTVSVEEEEIFAQTQGSASANKRSASRTPTAPPSAPAEAEQPSTQTIAPAPAPVVPPVKPSVAPELVHAGADLTKEMLKGSVGTAVKGAAGALSTAKKVAIAAAVVAFVIGAVAACLNFFVPAPNETVDKLVTSVDELDYDKMLSCFDSKTEKQIRAVMGITGDIVGSLTGISVDLEDLMDLAPSMAPYLEIPDLGIAGAETVLYADCSEKKIMEYCITANNGGSIPTGYLADNEIVNFLMEYKITLPGLENLIAKTAIVKITLENGEVGYLPLINEGWGDWRIPIMDMAMSSEGLG